MILLEIYKIFTRPYVYIAGLVTFIFILLFGLAFTFEGANYYNAFAANFVRGVEFEGDIINGNLFAYQLLHSIWMFVPLLVVFVSGGAISEEKKQKTLRLIMTRPISHSGFYTAKFIAVTVFLLILILLIGLLSLGAGLVFFGSGELLAFEQGKFFVLTSGYALKGFLIVYLYYFLVLLVVASLSLFFSVLYSNGLKAILVSSSVILIMYFISNLEIPFFETVRPFLFTTYFSSWSMVFAGNINWMAFSFDLIVLLVHILVFYALGLFFFTKKEILD